MRLPIVLVCLAGAGLAFAQDLRFDAASVRPSDGRETLPQYTPGRVSGTMTLYRLMIEAYHISPFQLSGGPSWLYSAKFAIDAKAAVAATRDEMRPMLQTLLAERFKLAVRRETKRLPVYALRVAKGGPKLREIMPGDPLPTPAPANPPLIRIFFVESTHDFVDRMNGGDSAGRPVVDQTGLPGVYAFDFLVHSSADFVESIEAQSGLRFEPDNAAVTTIAIEHAEKPDAD